MDETYWSRVTDLFHRLLDQTNPSAALAAEPDAAVREAAERLLRHHLRAEEENYLGESIAFDVLPVFESGQHLLRRFRIEKRLGSGGMGEVYLAWDERLEDKVALKTIARLLAPSDAIRRRFLAEVQNARRVTHPNVCRIHEIFDEGGVTFFSMEYLEGVPLSDLGPVQLGAGRAASIVRQIAEGLFAAHQKGIVHGDLKPANVMVVSADSPSPRPVIMDFGLARGLNPDQRPGMEFSVPAGSVDFMAPELHQGSIPDVRTDIFAFGRVGAWLMPGDRLWDQCTREKPEERPASLDLVIRKMRADRSRRYWIGGLLLGAGVVTTRWLTAPRDAQFLLPAEARILVNGFRSTVAPGMTRLARSVVMTVLTHGTRIHPVADDDLLPVLAQMKLRPDAVLDSGRLAAVMKQLRAAFWVDADLRQFGARYSLDVRIVAAGGRQLASVGFRDAPNLIELAQTAALWIRRGSGESRRSLAANSADITSYTSAVPEALEKYYEAMEHYAVAEMDDAIAFFEDAIRLDPHFAQAHSMRGMALNSSQFDEAFREVELGLRLSDRLPVHERVAIESNYYRLAADTAKMMALAEQGVADRPDEPRRFMALGQVLGLAGRFPEAVSAFRKAVTLAPGDWMHIQRLEAGLVEAGEFEESLRVFRDALAHSVSNRWIYNGAGSAYMGLERYEDAVSAFAAEPPSFTNTADVQAARILEGRFEVAGAALEEQRAAAANVMEAFQPNEFLCGLYFVTGRPANALRRVQDMSLLPAYPTMAERIRCTASWARRLADAETLAHVADSAAEMARRWPNARTRSVETHIHALQLWARNDLAAVADKLLESAGAAFSIWTLFDLAAFFTEQSRWELAEEYWRRFETHRGTVIVKGWFPGIIVLSWLYRAFAAQGRRDNKRAFAASRKVLEHWSRSNPLPHAVEEAERINFQSKPI